MGKNMGIVRAEMEIWRRAKRVRQWDHDWIINHKKGTVILPIAIWRYIKGGK